MFEDFDDVNRPPPFGGGQGRSPESIEADGESLGVTIAVCVFVLAVVLSVAEILARV